MDIVQNKMSKIFQWNGYTVEITKKKVKRINFRIKPADPKKIQMSIPYQVTYESALAILNQPKYIEFFQKYEKKLKEQPARPTNWYEEHEAFTDLYAKRLEKLLPGMFEKWQKQMGVSVAKVSIKDTRSQWGSCNVRNHNISISVWLGAFSDECIESVGVQELTHLLEKGHNGRFYGFMDMYYPNWKACKAKLKAMQSEDVGR